MHLRDRINHMIISVYFEDLTAYRRLKNVVLESIAKNDYIDQVEEDQKEAYVLNPSLLDGLQKLHPNFKSLLLRNSHINRDLGHADILASLHCR